VWGCGRYHMKISLWNDNDDDDDDADDDDNKK